MSVIDRKLSKENETRFFKISDPQKLMPCLFLFSATHRKDFNFCARKNRFQVEGAHEPENHLSSFSPEEFWRNNETSRVRSFHSSGTRFIFRISFSRILIYRNVAISWREVEKHYSDECLQLSRSAFSRAALSSSSPSLSPWRPCCIR